MGQKTNYKILVLSWVLAIVFLIIGIVSLVKGSVTELELGNNSYNFEAEYDEDYEYSFTPDSNATYIFSVSGGTLEDVEYSNGSKSFSEIDSFGENLYVVDLIEGVKYTFTVEANSYNLTVRIDYAEDFEF